MKLKYQNGSLKAGPRQWQQVIKDLENQKQSLASNFHKEARAAAWRTGQPRRPQGARACSRCKILMQ